MSPTRRDLFKSAAGLSLAALPAVAGAAPVVAVKPVASVPTVTHVASAFVSVKALRPSDLSTERMVTFTFDLCVLDDDSAEIRFYRAEDDEAPHLEVDLPPDVGRALYDAFLGPQSPFVA